jgi:hypothetical protein
MLCTATSAFDNVFFYIDKLTKRCTALTLSSRLSFDEHILRLSQFSDFGCRLEHAQWSCATRVAVCFTDVEAN